LFCNRIPRELVVYGNFWLRLIVAERLLKLGRHLGRHMRVAGL
jgi:hypothetical protein